MRRFNRSLHQKPAPFDLPYRVASRIHVNLVTNCWIWNGTKITRKGKLTYGQVGANGSRHVVHRYVFTHVFGPISKRLQVDHLCMNKLCCNPDHLEAVTQDENRRRYWATYSPSTVCKHGHEREFYAVRTGAPGNGLRQTCLECRRLGRFARQTR